MQEERLGGTLIMNDEGKPICVMPEEFEPDKTIIEEIKDVISSVGEFIESPANKALKLGLLFTLGLGIFMYVKKEDKNEKKNEHKDKEEDSESNEGQ